VARWRQEEPSPPRAPQFDKLMSNGNMYVQVKRLTEFEALYANEREEKLLMESRMNQRASDLQDALRQTQGEGRQYQELSDALRTEVQQVTHEKTGYVLRLGACILAPQIREIYCSS